MFNYYEEKFPYFFLQLTTIKTETQFTAKISQKHKAKTLRSLKI